MIVQVDKIKGASKAGFRLDSNIIAKQIMVPLYMLMAIKFLTKTLCSGW